ncbi:chemotaxis protein CheA, partial [Paenibacillus macerans]
PAPAPAPETKAANPAPAAKTPAQQGEHKSGARAGGGTPAPSRTIRVDIDRLDVLMNLLSELLIDRSRLEQLANEVKRADLTETVEHMSRVGSDLQNIVLKLRMVPIDTVFNRFPRMVRDLAKSLDKKIDLVIVGAETELDRTVIDEIGDPLVHLLRNAVDHGVEPVAERVAAGKPETGTVNLRAFHSGNHVFIEIEDDGHGIDRDKVLKKALKNGVVKESEAASMTDEQVYMLLFAPGFSTAEVISDISGRGVGLDVVKSKIESLSGVVSVQSKLGAGTKFSVQMPLTLSIISAMLIKVGAEKYAIPLSSIVETGLIKREQVRELHGYTMIPYRDTHIPLMSLAQLFDIPGFSESDEEETEIVVIRKGDRMAALAVESFIGQSEIVIKNLGKYLPAIQGVAGATILGDGQVALIIDPNAFIK